MSDLPVPTAYRLIKFGDFDVDAVTGELHKFGVRVRMERQPFKLLLALLERPGDLVTREELRRVLSPDIDFGDFEHAINVAMAKLRAALSDQLNPPRYIETLHKRGYRFVARVEYAAEGVATTELGTNGLARANGLARGNGQALPDLALAGPPSTFTSGRAFAAGRDSANRRWTLLLALGGTVAYIAIALVVAVPRQWFTRLLRSGPAHVNSIAVLPLLNLTGDPQQDYLVDGMTEALTTDLAKIDSLKVISRTSAMHFKGTKLTLPEIARQLKVDALLEGSVSREADHMAVRVQLVDGATDQHLWAESYERNQQDVVVIQNEIALAVAREIRPQLTGENAQRFSTKHQVDGRAFDEYLRGRYEWNKRTPEAVQKSVEHFQRAIALDPAYGQAYAGLADSYLILGGYGYTPSAEYMLKAKAAALKALEIDSQLAEAHATLAEVYGAYYWDLALAEREVQRAIALQPNYATAYFYYTDILVTGGRYREAIPQAEKAYALDPLSPVIASWRSIPYSHSRQCDRAIELDRDTIEQFPDFWLNYKHIGSCYVEKRMYEEARIAFMKGLELSPNNSGLLARLAHLNGVSGRKEDAQRIVYKLSDKSTFPYVSPVNWAIAYQGLGDTDRVFAYFEEAYRERDNILPVALFYPIFDPIRSDPRFVSLLQRVSVPFPEN